MGSTSSGVVSSADGIIVLQDLDDRAVEDLRSASAEARTRARRPGFSRRGGAPWVVAPAGGAMYIKCADQFSRVTVSVVADDGPPHKFGRGWQWLEEVVLTLYSGRLLIRAPDSDAIAPLDKVDAGAGSGIYRLAIACKGREAAKQAIAEHFRRDFANRAEEDEDWRRIADIEQYRLHVWPDLNDGRGPELR